MFRSTAILLSLGIVGATLSCATQRTEHLNPMIRHHEAGQPIFGLYAPSAGRGGGRGGGEAPARTPMDLANDTIAFTMADYMFNGGMEGSVDRGLPGFVDYVSAMRAAGATAATHPIVVKTPRIADDPAMAIENISRQLDAGASGIMFVGVETAEEVRQGLAAMRYASNGGTRPDSVGDAPAYWGLSPADYKARADLWPLSPNGELVNWTIVESKAGLANVREIAAVPGIGVLWPGAGTLRRVFSDTGPDGERVFDEPGWEGAIQQVLAACKEFKVACGFPANANDIELRLQQGFTVFVMGWGEAGFGTVEIGRRAAGR